MFKTACQFVRQWAPARRRWVLARHDCRWQRGLLVLLGCILAGTALAAPKTDIVTPKNGDHLTGEVKSLERGKFRLSTDAMSTVSTEWADIRSLQSEQNIQVETAAGVRYLGHLVSAGQDNVLAAQTESERVNLAIGELVLIWRPSKRRG